MNLDELETNLKIAKIKYYKKYVWMEIPGFKNYLISNHG